MPRYADTLLADGERIALRTRQHWLATIIDGRYPWLILVAAIVLLLISQNITGGPRDVLGWVVLALFLIAIAWLIRVYWNWWAQDYIITNRRVLKVEGIINKRSADSSLEKINDAVLEQNLVGRLLNYGDLDILTAADVAVDRYRMLNRAPAFKRTMLNEKHELEGEFSRPLPTPPLRAPGPAPATPPREMAADEVTRALASLADLRDRGAISAEEYETKKAELLARL
ncbi:MAG TPA: PH domain-containing protein [Candidatus Limnocylindrales bacterium]|jgi:hypothetical protein